MNDSEQERQTTNALKFGDTIQFKHKYTDKFLCVLESESAMLEANAVRVTMQDYSSKDCFFKIMPRFKVRNEGEQVRAGDQIQIIVDHIRGHALQRSANPIRNDNFTFEKELGSYEICLSSTQTTWTIGMYTKAAKDAGSNSVKAGDIVQLADKEHGGIISMTEMCKCSSGQKLTGSGAPVKKYGHLQKKRGEGGDSRWCSAIPSPPYPPPNTGGTKYRHRSVVSYAC